MPERKRRISESIILMLVAGALGGCSSGPNIRADYDRSADFGSYKTYNFMEGAGPENSSYQSFFSQYMVDAITVEMEKRGYTKSDNPDILVNFNAILQDKTKVSTSPAPPPMHGGYYGYRGGSYGAWGGYGYGTTTHVSQYVEGTVNVDMVDLRLKRMVWEGIAFGRLKEDRTNEERRVAIEEGVTLMFEGYPYTTSQ